MVGSKHVQRVVTSDKQTFSHELGVEEMSEYKMKLSGTQGVVALVLVIGYVGFSILSFGENRDPKLRAFIQRELQNELAGMLATASKSYDPEDLASAEEFIRATDTSQITIHSIYTSKPLLSFSSSQQVVAKVEFTLPATGSKRQQKFFSLTYSLLTGWSGGIETTSTAYYTNFF